MYKNESKIQIIKLNKLLVIQIISIKLFGSSLQLELSVKHNRINL